MRPGKDLVKVDGAADLLILKETAGLLDLTSFLNNLPKMVGVDDLLVSVLTRASVLTEAAGVGVGVLSLEVAVTLGLAEFFF